MMAAGPRLVLWLELVGIFHWHVPITIALEFSDPVLRHSRRHHWHRRIVARHACGQTAVWIPLRTGVGAAVLASVLM